MTVLCFLDHRPIIPPQLTSSEPVAGDTNRVFVTVASLTAGDTQ